MTVFVSNWGSHATPGHHGAGRKLTIMAMPRRWEHGDGSVPLLTPDPQDVRDVQRGEVTGDAYRARFYRLVAFRVRRKGMGIAPGALLAADGRPVEPGDTLLCACGAEKARERRCHRVWVGDLLALAGWEVVLDGAVIDASCAADRVRAEASVNP